LLYFRRPYPASKTIVGVRLGAIRSMRKTGFIFYSILFCFLGSCSDKSSLRVINVPPTPVLSRSLGWAVVESAYAQVYDAPGSAGVVLGYYRRAVILPVVERRIERVKTETIQWIRNEGTTPGWIRESDLQVFESEAKAKTAMESMQP